MMTRSALKHLALAGMVGAGAVSGVKEAKAEPKPWNSISDLTYDARIYQDGDAADYVANSITFKDQNGNVIANNPRFSLVYIANYPNGSSAIAGGLDGFGSSASGWFNQRSIYDHGLMIGQTANYPSAGNGYWEVIG
ncbi:MAG TPA: hypothetical protein PLG04_11080 [Anaerolineaceae bacterium]|nr:hypothetical protein [Anaerolineaceae bacterium]